MADREWLLGLARALHTTLEPEGLVRLFAERTAEVVPFDGMHFSHPGDQIDVFAGDAATHSCAYDLVLEERSLGTFSLTRATPFSDDETATIEDLLANLVHPLRNALMYREALRAAALDPLTGINNRAGFVSALDREIELSRRQTNDLSLVMLDADEFKSVNDRYGHTAGDEVLRALAACLQRCVRDSDLLFRYGGEEFVVLLSATSLDGARLLAERIRAAVADLTVTHAGEHISITVSIGVATLAPGERAAELLRRADSAMYDAKSRGRNRVAQSGGEREPQESPRSATGA